MRGIEKRRPHTRKESEGERDNGLRLATASTGGRSQRRQSLCRERQLNPGRKKARRQMVVEARFGRFRRQKFAAENVI